MEKPSVSLGDLSKILLLLFSNVGARSATCLSNAFPDFQSEFGNGS